MPSTRSQACQCNGTTTITRAQGACVGACASHNEKVWSHYDNTWSQSDKVCSHIEKGFWLWNCGCLCLCERGKINLAICAKYNNLYAQEHKA